MSNQVLLLIVFNLFVFVMLILDLGVFHRNVHIVKIKEALIWSGVWITMAVLFNLVIYFYYGLDKALEFLAGYLIEESLSVDNLFIFLVIFSYFCIPSVYQHKILFWGIIGAVILRAIFITTGVVLVHKFHWVIYLFGILLIITGTKMAFHKDKELHPEKNILLKLFRRLMPVTQDYKGSRFFVKQDGRYAATPLFIVLLVVETTDLIFAIDSIPAILAITTDPFIVYTSNVFALLGLRSLYFALAGLMKLFHYLHYGLSVILIFVGIKMLIAFVYKIPIIIALCIIGGILIISVIASIIKPADEITQLQTDSLKKK